jgi:integrase
MAKDEEAKEPRFPMRVKRGFAVVTIYRRKHPKTASGFVYTVAWTVGGHRYTLQRATLQKAQIEAAAKVEHLSSGRLAASSLTTDDASILVHARRICGATSIVSALEEWSAARKLSGGQLIQAARHWAERSGPAKSTSVPEAVKLFLKEKKARGINVSASYEHVLPKLANQFNCPMEAVTASMLENWIVRTFKSTNEKIHPATFNTARKRVITLWRWARVKRMLPQDVLTEAERIASAKETPKRREIMSVPEFARVLMLLSTQQPNYLATAVLAGFCGLRREELHAQLWRDINLKAARLAVTAAKQGTPEERLVEIPEAALEWLALCDHSKELVAPSLAMDRIRSFCRNATPPITCPENVFRHSFVSYRVAASGSVAATALEAGNSAGVIFKHYRRPLTKSDGEAWFALTPKKVAFYCAMLEGNK